MNGDAAIKIDNQIGLKIAAPAKSKHSNARGFGIISANDFKVVGSGQYDIRV